MMYSRVHKSSDSFFSKILEKPSIVQKKMIPHIKGLRFSLKWSKKGSSNPGPAFAILVLWYRSPCISRFLVPKVIHEMRGSWIAVFVFSVEPQNGSKTFQKSSFWAFSHDFFSFLYWNSILKYSKASRYTVLSHTGLADVRFIIGFKTTWDFKHGCNFSSD